MAHEPEIDARDKFPSHIQIIATNNTYGLSPLRAYSLKRGLVLSSFQHILEGEEQSSTKKEESNDEYHADETRTGYGARLR
ncbi:MAG: hypothetical protein ACJ8BW_16370, partial [Ktedonobacteraceae bacterium]